MPVRLRTTLLVTLALALHGCGEGFVTTGGTGSADGTLGTGAAGSASSTAGTGATGGVTTAAGGGGAGASCDGADDDGDGFSECDGDCDDTSVFAHPMALEICGDGVDEDCDGADGEGEACDAHNVFVSQQHGKVGAPGTRAEPVATIGEGVTRAKALGGAVAILVSAGTYTEDVTLSGSLSLVGGYDPEDWSTRDIVTHETIVKDTTPQGMKLIGLGPETIVDGFTIEGRSVIDPGDSSVAVTIDGGSPLLANASITAGSVSAGAGSSITVRVVAEGASAGKPSIFDSTLTAGPASAGPTCGILVDAEGAEIAIARNAITAGKGTNSIALHVVNAAATYAAQNSLQSRSATGTANSPSVSLGAWIETGALVLDANLVNPDQVTNPPKCFTPEVWCGGVRLSSPGAIVTNNVIAGSASDQSAALHVVERKDGPDLDGVVVSSNRLQGAGRDALLTVSAAVLIASPREDAVATKVGRFRNNILRGGIADHNYGVLEERVLAESCDPAALDHDLFYFTGAPSKSSFYGDWDGVTMTNLAALDDLPGAGEHIAGDPLLTNGHIGEDSPCANAGTAADAPDHDIDGDPRPQQGFFDIGPDEYAPPD